jgi:hypothetical protein
MEIMVEGDGYMLVFSCDALLPRNVSSLDRQPKLPEVKFGNFSANSIVAVSLLFSDHLWATWQLLP